MHKPSQFRLYCILMQVEILTIPGQQKLMYLILDRHITPISSAAILV